MFLVFEGLIAFAAWYFACGGAFESVVSEFDFEEFLRD
jgi:hypothetical protein